MHLKAKQKETNGRVSQDTLLLGALSLYPSGQSLFIISAVIRKHLIILIRQRDLSNPGETYKRQDTVGDEDGIQY